VTDWPSPASPPDEAVAFGRFGFFGAVAAVEVSEPDFLALTVVVVVGFVLPPLLPVFVDVSLPAELVLLLPLAPAPSSPADAEDWDDSVEADDEGDWVSGPDVEDESVEEADEDESVGSAHATAGVVATATPTPKATAKPPTRPTYFAYPITTALPVRLQNSS
jgi:hypothetical protein